MYWKGIVMNNLLSKVHKGMKVYDQAQNEIGKVEYVQFGDEDPLKPGPETATVSRAQRNQEYTLVHDIANAFQTDDLPDTLKERLMRYGFIRLDASGLFNADRYIFPNQIKSVDGNRVTLNVGKAELVQRT